MYMQIWPYHVKEEIIRVQKNSNAHWFCVLLKGIADPVDISEVRGKRSVMERVEPFP